MSRDALVVGINTYHHLPELQAPAQDAESVARCLESFGECRVTRLPEAIIHQKPAVSQRSMVTTSVLEEALIKLFKPAGKTIPQTAIFYYSGHGLQRQAGIQEGYLATSDANPEAGHYGLSLHWLRRLLQESPVRQRVILLDCCNSGEFFNMLEADPGARAGTDRLFMAAAREYEAAYEALGSNHSVFTQALLSGLNPYKVKGGIVNGHSLTDVVNRELKGELQQPLFESSGSEIVLTRLAGLSAPARETQPPLLERLQKLRYGFCPFPGAAPFESAHSDLFFGRDDIGQTLLNRVRSSRLCVLMGASGVGKTSLLQAGLMPQLSRCADETAWDVRYTALKASPLASLAELFVDPEVTGLRRAEQLRRAESFLQQGAAGFGQLVQAVVSERGPGHQLVLVLDQFEVLLTPGACSDRDRRLIIDGLTAAIEQEHLPLHLVLGLQSHRLADLADVPTFQALVAAHRLTVPTMTYNQLKATIVGPLEKTGLRYDANLVYTLLLDMVSAPADLALLQIILKELWLRREHTPNDSEPPRLTLAAYVEMGGVRQLLNQRADSLYQSLSAAEQAIAQRVFLSLCDPGDGAAATRRSVSLSELVTAAMPEAAVVATLEKLLAARLVVAQDHKVEGLGAEQAAIAVPGWSPSSSLPAEPSSLSWPVNSPSSLAPAASDNGPNGLAAPNDACFDIAHEALIRNWPLLQQWLQSLGPIVRQQRAIEAAAQEWHHQRQPNHPDYFLPETRLGEAKGFRQAHGEQLSVLAHGYLEACDRYAKRCCRQRHLVRLLIPLSMATGMLTAYAHSYMTQPGAELVLAKAPPSAISDVRPSFTLAAPSPEKEDTPALGSPQAGIVRTDVLALASTLSSPPPQAQLQAAPQLQATLKRSANGLVNSSPTSNAAPAQAANLPSANQVVQLEAWWVSPHDPSVVIQIWCTSGATEPVCFTSTAAHHQ
ncbi:caspase family protein [Nodosilinea sp. LEGE 06152]|uniref:nSTAND1 domain-containing NTPase n=1 Tax=Nodosilinea sp. LEGE 06152 TaxID=2777966 RepID=UPI00187E538B|nr:caspase family protein [Nodosilinea sp. LEGE 06152]MBE9157308.1 caspase family protein [Nodosilinea sp. LEGE 06152]